MPWRVGKGVGVAARPFLDAVIAQSVRTIPEGEKCAKPNAFIGLGEVVQRPRGVASPDDLHATGPDRPTGDEDEDRPLVVPYRPTAPQPEPPS